MARYIVASGAIGAWAGWDLDVAYYVDCAWMRLVPRQSPADIIVWMPFHQLGHDLFEARFDRGILSRLEAEEVSCELRQVVVLEDPLDERVDVLAAGWANDAKFRRIASERVGEPRLHAPARSSACRPPAVACPHLVARIKSNA